MKTAFVLEEVIPITAGSIRVPRVVSGVAPETNGWQRREPANDKLPIRASRSNSAGRRIEPAGGGCHPHLADIPGNS